MIEISDRCQYPGCRNKTDIWCEGIAACAEHERWLKDAITNLIEARKIDDAIRNRNVTYTCPRCGMTSHNPHDAKHRYCGNCHQFESP